MLGAALASGCERDTLAQIRERGFIRAGYAEEPPFAFVTEAGVEGESPRALAAAARDADIPQVRWVRMSFPELLPSLEQGRIDVVAAGLYRTAEREKVARFTRATACSRTALLVRTADAAASAEEVLDDPSAAVAVLRGSVEARLLAARGVPSGRILQAPDFQVARVALAGGRVRALAISEATARHHLLGDPGPLRILPGPGPADGTSPDTGCSALAVRLGDRRLAEALDRGVARLLDAPAHRAYLDSLGFLLPEVER